MTIQQLLILFIVAAILIFLLVLLWLRHKEILSFFFPDRYVLIEMLELDNNVAQWIQAKNKDLRFEFNEGKYNMYHEGYDSKKKKRNPAIYREGRLAKFYYYEGESDPLDFRLQQVSSNPKISKQIDSLNLGLIFEDDKPPLQLFLEKYLVWIVIGILGFMIITSSMKGGP